MYTFFIYMTKRDRGAGVAADVGIAGGKYMSLFSYKIVKKIPQKKVNHLNNDSHYLFHYNLFCIKNYYMMGNVCEVLKIANWSFLCIRKNNTIIIIIINCICIFLRYALQKLKQMLLVMEVYKC